MDNLENILGFDASLNKEIFWVDESLKIIKAYE